MRATRLARAVTEIFAPAILATAMPVVIAVAAHPNPWAGLGWGLLAALFSSAIPYAVIRIGVAMGLLTDHHIGRREQRKIPVFIGVGSVVTGLILLVILGAPRPLIAMIIVMLACLVGIGVVNLAWKLSAHAAVAAGSAAVLVIEFGPWLLLTAPVVALIAWSRVRLRDHTVPQVLAGAALGITVSAPLYLLLR